VSRYTRQSVKLSTRTSKHKATMRSRKEGKMEVDEQEAASKQVGPLKQIAGQKIGRDEMDTVKKVGQREKSKKTVLIDWLASRAAA
jgi:hypothetical protein